MGLSVVSLDPTPPGVPIPLKVMNFYEKWRGTNEADPFMVHSLHPLGEVSHFSCIVVCFLLVSRVMFGAVFLLLPFAR